MKEGSGDRFFRAMVLMGSSMALGCGGTTNRTGGSPDSAGGAGGAGGSGGSGPGGTGAGGSGPIFITTTTTGVGGIGSGDPGPFPCVPAQWECESTPLECSNTYNAWQLPTECACSDTRPKSAADCASGQSFVCLEGAPRDGAPDVGSVLFNCACVEADGDCGVECTAAGFSGAPYCRQVVGEGGAAGAPVVETLCGCAVVVLK